MHVMPGEHLSERCECKAFRSALGLWSFPSFSFSDGRYRPVGTGKESGRFVQTGSVFWDWNDCWFHSGRQPQHSIRVSTSVWIFLASPSCLHLPPPSARFLFIKTVFTSYLPGRNVPPASVLQAASSASCWSWSSSPKTPKFMLHQPTPPVSHASATPTIIDYNRKRSGWWCREDVIQMLRCLTCCRSADTRGWPLTPRVRFDFSCKMKNSDGVVADMYTWGRPCERK